ncbi:MAG: hypothetical protein RMM58_02530 [Chloroflexota bacterium]|nr:hypothetical protein [Dehalococcoidia bacterium]MDW8252734.1 hypothetical protein [Chloroflexota bacterium]
MDYEFGLDFHEIERNFEDAEVLSVYFPLFARTLVVDMRTDATSEPLIRVMPMASSLQERYRSLRRLRPQFPQPNRIAFVPWPKYVETLVRLGLWDRLVRRLERGGFRQSLADAERALEELRAFERATILSAITGRGFKNLWPVSR